jgi:hypothetical protein
MGIEERILIRQVAALMHAATFPTLLGGAVAPASSRGHGHDFSGAQRVLIGAQGRTSHLIPHRIKRRQ